MSSENKFHPKTNQMIKFIKDSNTITLIRRVAWYPMHFDNKVVGIRFKTEMDFNLNKGTSKCCLDVDIETLLGKELYDYCEKLYLQYKEDNYNTDLIRNNLLYVHSSCYREQYGNFIPVKLIDNILITEYETRNDITVKDVSEDLQVVNKLRELFKTTVIY